MKSTATERTSSGKAASSARMKGNPQDRLNYIATAAYYKAEAHGFMPGQELDNWLEAEAEFDEREGQ
jgi:hypothetical protein